jgi:hypothetical protein
VDNLSAIQQHKKNPLLCVRKVAYCNRYTDVLFTSSFDTPVQCSVLAQSYLGEM